MHFRVQRLLNKYQKTPISLFLSTTPSAHRCAHSLSRRAVRHSVVEEEEEEEGEEEGLFKADARGRASEAWPVTEEAQANFLVIDDLIAHATCVSLWI